MREEGSDKKVLKYTALAILFVVIGYILWALSVLWRWPGSFSDFPWIKPWEWKDWESKHPHRSSKPPAKAVGAANTGVQYGSSPLGVSTYVWIPVLVLAAFLAWWFFFRHKTPSAPAVPDGS